MKTRSAFAVVSRSIFLLTLVGTCKATLAASIFPAAAQNGMVVTVQHLATHVGVDVLKRGGNAVDAAVAVGYALAVVYPAAGNIGGGGFMTIRLADGRETFIDFREKAPLAATRDMYLDKSGNVVPGLSTVGWLSAGVPGTVAGMEYAREHYGTLSRQALIEPAIQLARRGFVLDQGDIDLFDLKTSLFKADPQGSGSIFLKDGHPFKAGDTFVNPRLANALEAISEKGTAGFYKGWVAKDLVDSSRAGGGILTQADLDQYEARELKPVTCDYRGYHVISAPPPSSGGVALCEMLNILEGYPLKQLGYGSAEAVHDEIEAMRYAYRDRNTYLGDPAFVKNPIDHLLSKSYAAQLRAQIDPHHAGTSISVPNNVPREGNDTTHYSIVDRWGNAVSVTYTLNSWFGAGVIGHRSGILLNDEMDDFTSKVGVPNQYGLVQGEANAIAPGKRPLSSMTPTILSKDGQPVMVVGTPGGSRIITATLLTILNVLDYGMNIQEAVDAPRIHQQWRPETTNLERFALSPDTEHILESWGYKFSGPQPPNHVEAILIGAPVIGGHQLLNDRFYGANDPRQDSNGLALGY
jgi:gamma-glutamyltranspeptidase/glutathione hydrolase